MPDSFDRSGGSAGRRARPLLAGLLLAAFVSLGVAPPAVAVGPAPGGPPSRSQPNCAAPSRDFRPTSIGVPGVLRRTRVLRRGQDASGVPRTPPLTAKGKWQFAWDGSVRAGALSGVVRLTAHTYPAFAGKALGNRLLARLQLGKVLVVSDSHGRRLCYRVSRRLSVAANRRVPAYYSTGRHRLAILVCSGVRRGPGNWSRRTLWFARPVG